MGEKSAEQEFFEKNSTIDRHELYHGGTIRLRCDSLKKKDGSIKKWDIVVHPGAVVIIPVTQNKELILVKQWRRAIEKRIIELPAGTLEPNESPQTCAQRELQEETGFSANKLISLGGFYSTPGFCTEYLHLFLALDLEKKPLPPDEDEKIDLLFVSLKEAKKMIDSGEICDAKTIAGVLRYVYWSTPS